MSEHLTTGKFFFLQFPAVFSVPTFGSTLQDGILFGMVGAYDWVGSVLWLEEGRRLFPPPTALEDEFPPALQNHAAYLGESQRGAGNWESQGDPLRGYEALRLNPHSLTLSSPKSPKTSPYAFSKPSSLTSCCSFYITASSL